MAAQLTSDRSGTLPDPGLIVVRGPSGRIFTTTSERGIVVAWSPEGEFLARIGGLGEGPEEFGIVRGLLPGDRAEVHVLHGNGRWSVIDRDLGVSTVTSHPVLFTASGINTDIIGDSVLVFAGFLGDSPDRILHVLRPGDRSVASFRERSESEMQGVSLPPSVAWFGEPDAVWTGPWQSAPGAYRLEKWSTSGELVRTIERRADWLVVGGTQRSGTAEAVRSSAFRLQPYEASVAYVSMRLPRASGDDPDADPHSRERTAVRYDLIDLTDGTILSAGRGDGPAGGEPPMLTGVFPRTRMGYLTRTDELGLRTIRLQEVRFTSYDPAAGVCLLDG
jgi:hypothetical protein